VTLWIGRDSSRSRLSIWRFNQTVGSGFRGNLESYCEIFGEFDDPPDEIEDDPLRIQREPESADVIDVEIEVVEDAGYTDAGMSHLPGTATPDDQDQSLSVELSGPLGMTGPVGSGLMSLSDAVEAQAEKRAGEAARVRDTRWC
jgi:hypothetical protein